MTSETGTQRRALSRLSRALPAILVQMFFPPPRFSPEVEDEFRAESEARAGAARQTAIILLLMIWVSYFGWDSFHAYRNELFREGVDARFVMRLAGTACIFLSGVSLMLWRGHRRVSAASLSFCLISLYLLSLGV